VELTTRYQLNPTTSLFANYTYTFTEDLATGQSLLRRAPHKASVGINRRLWSERANLYAQLLYVSPRLDSFNGAPVDLGEYYLLNVASTYDVSPYWQLFARIDNLLDQNYEEVYGFGTPGIAFYGGTTMRW